MSAVGAAPAGAPGLHPLAVIPARRGSKRLAEKNTRALGGRPMLAYTVDAALASGVFDRVYVSTEDGATAALAEGLGAMAHARPAALAGDLVSATDVCLDVLDSRDAVGDAHGAVVCLQPSSPLRTAADVAGAWGAFVERGADFLVSTSPVDPHYFHWAVRPDGAWWAMWFGADFMRERSELPPVARPNGAIKIARAGPLRALGNFFGPRLAAYEMPDARGIHVATAFDLELAEFLLGRRAPAAPLPAGRRARAGSAA